LWSYIKRFRGAESTITDMGEFDFPTGTGEDRDRKLAPALQCRSTARLARPQAA